MVLGYSLLQIPDFIIFIVTRTKRWPSQIQNLRSQSHTRVCNVRIKKTESTSKGISEKETNDVFNRNGAVVYTDAKYGEIMKRIIQIENSMNSKLEEIIKKMEQLENSTYGAMT